jgi:hypothetical protein
MNNFCSKFQNCKMILKLFILHERIVILFKHSQTVIIKGHNLWHLVLSWSPLKFHWKNLRILHCFNVTIKYKKVLNICQSSFKASSIGFHWNQYRNASRLTLKPCHTRPCCLMLIHLKGSFVISSVTYLPFWIVSRMSLCFQEIE